MQSNDRRALILGLVGIVAIAAIVVLVTQLTAWAEYHKIVGAAEDAFAAGDYGSAAAAYEYAAKCYLSVPELAEKAASSKQLFTEEQRKLFEAVIADGDGCLAKQDYMGALDCYTAAQAATFKLPLGVEAHMRQAYIKQGERLMASGEWKAVQSWYACEFFESSPELSLIASSATKRCTMEIQAERKKVAAEAARRQRVMDIKQMSHYEGEPVAIAVADVELRRSMSNSIANESSRFVLICIAAKNVSEESQHVNPNDFTLSDSDGFTVSHDSETYGLSNYFDAVTLAPGHHTSGWLVFLTTKDSEYTLNRNDFSGNIEKRVIIK